VTVLTLTLPEPPSVNRIWRKGKHGQTYLAPSAKHFHDATYAAVLKARITRPMFDAETPVKVTLTWYRSRKSGDLDNRTKLVADALNGLAYADDKQIVEWHLYRVDGQRPGRVEVTVERAA
jgi:Holliday junction resolvase RusA-like endonuclease